MVDPARFSLLDSLNSEYKNLLVEFRRLVCDTPADLLYGVPPQISIAENILKGAGVLEQVFGGLTVNLWDDPFEWTLPETLSTSALILGYLDEVDQAMAGAFVSFSNDEALTKLALGPAGEPVIVFRLLIDALVRAADYRGRAFATLKSLTGASHTGTL